MRKALAAVISILIIAIILMEFIVAPGKREPFALSGTKNTMQERPVREAVQIKLLWEQMEPEQYERWQKYYIKPVMERYPEIRIDFMPTPNHQQVTKVQLAAGQGPDLFLAEPANVVEFAKSGRLMELDSFVQKYRWDKIIFNWALNSMKVDGKQMGIPHAYEGCLFWYNKDLLDKNGWPVPKSRAEFETVCAQALSKGYIAVAYGTADIKSNNMWVISDYFSAYSGMEAMRELLTGRIRFDDPRVKGAVELYQRDWQAGWFNDRQTFSLGYHDMNSLWIKQKALFLPQGTWFGAQIESLKPEFNYGIARFPSMRDGVSDCMPIGIGAAMVVNRNTREADAVAKVIDAIYTNEKNLAAAVAAGEQTLARNISSELYPRNMNRHVRTLMDITTESNADRKIGYTLWTFFPGKTTVYLYENIDRLLLGKASLDQYLEGAQKQLDQDLMNGWRFPEP